MSEVLLELPDDGRPRTFRLRRVDLSTGDGNRALVREVNVSTYLQFDPIRVRTSAGLGVQLAPIAWNGAELTVEGVEPNDPALEQWCRDWLDVDGAAAPKADGLLGVIHSMTAPSGGDGTTGFSVDFGSAPTGAVMHLLTVLRERGAREVRLVSPWMTAR